MFTLHPQYIKDANGKNSLVILSAKEFEDILEELEELEDIRLYDEAKASNQPSVPIDDAFKLIESKRKTR